MSHLDYRCCCLSVFACNERLDLRDRGCIAACYLAHHELESDLIIIIVMIIMLQSL